MCVFDELESSFEKIRHVFELDGQRKGKSIQTILKLDVSTAQEAECRRNQPSLPLKRKFLSIAKPQTSSRAVLFIPGKIKPLLANCASKKILELLSKSVYQ